MEHDFKNFPELTNSQLRVFYFESPHKQIVDNFTAHVVKVHDGDTITLRWEERDFDFPLRFINIAAPELDEDGGDKSKSWLEQLLLDQDVDIIIDRDNRVEKWGRLLGNVMFEGLDVGQQSIFNGTAISWSEKENAFA